MNKETTNELEVCPAKNLAQNMFDQFKIYVKEHEINPGLHKLHLISWVGPELEALKEAASRETEDIFYKELWRLFDEL